MLVVDMLLIRFDMLINLKKGSIQENTTTLINTEKKVRRISPCPCSCPCYCPGSGKNPWKNPGWIGRCSNSGKNPWKSEEHSSGSGKYPWEDPGRIGRCTALSPLLMVLIDISVCLGCAI